MLSGMQVDPNPMLNNAGKDTAIAVIFEDEYMAVINKPSGLLSVPGKTIEDSVAHRLKIQYPAATGPLIVHRLDQDTSGLMLIAKSKEIHKILQQQFIKRTIKKRYIALLEAKVEIDSGKIDLPLRVDLDNRPAQVVCYEHGKSAITNYQVLDNKDGKTRIHFHPVTGRTHQLRMHAAHVDGLNSPIIGDSLYGNKANRLHLHAEWIELHHPFNKKVISFSIEAPF